jgi:hypothetical protein
MATLAKAAVAGEALAVGGVALTVTLASGLIGYYVLPEDSAKRFYNWAASLLGAALSYFTGTGSTVVAMPNGTSETIGVSKTNGPNGSGYWNWNTNGQTTMSWPFTGPSDEDAARTAAIGAANSRINELSAAGGKVADGVDVSNLTPQQLASAPPVAAYITPGLAEAISAGADYTISRAYYPAADIPAIAATFGAQYTDGASKPEDVTVNLDKSGLATDALQRQQIVSMDCAAVGIQTLPDRLVEKLSDTGEMTIDQRWQRVIDIASVRFPFSMSTILPTDPQQFIFSQQQAEPIRPTGFHLIPGNEASFVNVDFRNGSIHEAANTAARWFWHLENGLIIVALIYYLWRRVNTI